MDRLKYTLVGDGSSDRVLQPVINWLLNDLYPELPVSGVYADFGGLWKPPAKGDIKGQVKHAQRYYPFDILIYHRDAEQNSNEIIATRIAEILDNIKDVIEPQKIVCVVPIVMTEAWLLIDANAIKKASGNRNYSGVLNLPPIQTLEQKNDPKDILFNLLKTANDSKKRNLNKFKPHAAVHFVAENIKDFSSLRELRSFKQFESDLKSAIDGYLIDKAKI